MQYYKVNITETGKPCKGSREEYEVFNQISETFYPLENALDYLEDRYGKGGLNKEQKIYRDDANGNPIEVGFVSKGFVNKDLSHDSESWYQKDWVTIEKVTTEPVFAHLMDRLAN